MVIEESMFFGFTNLISCVKVLREKNDIKEGSEEGENGKSKDECFKGLCFRLDEEDEDGACV